jgi:hypothetical protein
MASMSRKPAMAALGNRRLVGYSFRFMRVSFLLFLILLPALVAATPVPAAALSESTTISAEPVSVPTLPLTETALQEAAPTLRPEALRAALNSWHALRAAGEIARPLMTVIDYSLPSTARRLWVFDMETGRLLFHELVAHGRGSGEDLATLFSNVEGSLMTSLGAFVTGGTYQGRNGYSMRLRGVDAGVNDLAEARAIVMHGAWYVSEAFARKVGRLGRSWGCPALRPEIAKTLIDAIKDRSLLYAWHPGAPSMAAASTPR